MKYIVQISEFSSLTEAKLYLEAQEKMLLECLHGDNGALKPRDMNHFIPELAREWKKYLNTPGVSSSDQNSAIIHCAELLRFKKRRECSFDYE